MLKVKIFIARVKLAMRVLGIWSLGVLFGASVVYVSIEGREIVKTLSNAEKGASIVLENKKSITMPETVENEPIAWNTGEFSAYTSAADETDANGAIAANNKPVFVGGIACPSFLAFGDKIEVKNKGVFTCNDRMAARYRNGNYFDIYHETKAEAFAFGRKSLEWRKI